MTLKPKEQENPMQYKFGQEEEAFRQELRDFLKAELPRKWRYGLIETAEEDTELARAMRRNWPTGAG